MELTEDGEEQIIEPDDSQPIPMNQTISSSQPTASQQAEASGPPQKLIIFAHHLEMMDAIDHLLKAKGVGFMRIDGGTAVKDRAALVDKFQRNAATRVALLSLTCGSTGLNLGTNSGQIFVLPSKASTNSPLRFCVFFAQLRPPLWSLRSFTGIQER